MVQRRPYQNTADKRNLQGSWHHVEDHGRQQETDALGSTVNRSRQTTGLPREVEVKIELEQVLEYISRDLADRLLRNTSEYSIAQFLEQCSPDPSNTVW